MATQRGITVRGRLKSPTELVLDEPVADLGGEAVEITIRALPLASAGPRLVDIVRAHPPGQASKSQLDRRLHDERDAWDR